MAVPRRPRARPLGRTVSATGRPAVALSPSTPWRDLVVDDVDLDGLAARLARAARWSCAGDKKFNANTVPSPTGDPAAAVDSIDTWLLLADAGSIAPDTRGADHGHGVRR